jgi:hypothetical protein
VITNENTLFLHRASFKLNHNFYRGNTWLEMYCPIFL